LGYHNQVGADYAGNITAFFLSARDTLAQGKLDLPCIPRERILVVGNLTKEFSMISRRRVLAGIVSTPFYQAIATVPVVEVKAAAAAADAASLSDLVLQLVGHDSGEMWRNLALRGAKRIMAEASAPGADARIVLERYFGKDAVIEFFEAAPSLNVTAARILVATDQHSSVDCEQDILAAPLPTADQMEA
jgi:hypothetical protein